jgi:hypothetical protein
VLEELTVARWRNVPCIVVGAFGGLAGGLGADILRQFSAGNDMDEKSVAAMAVWDGEADVDQYVGVILGHLAKLLRKSQDTPPAAWPPVRVPAATGIDDRMFAPDVAALERARLRTVARAVRRVDVPADLVRQCSDRFARVLAACEKAEANLIGELLASPPAAAAQPAAPPALGLEG